MGDRPTPAWAWHELVAVIITALRLDAAVDRLGAWSERQRWLVWLDERLRWVPPWWKVWAWCACAYAAAVIGVMIWAWLTGRWP